MLTTLQKDKEFRRHTSRLRVFLSQNRNRVILGVTAGLLLFVMFSVGSSRGMLPRPNHPNLSSDNTIKKPKQHQFDPIPKPNVRDPVADDDLPPWDRPKVPDVPDNQGQPDQKDNQAEPKQVEQDPVVDPVEEPVVVPGVDMGFRDEAKLAAVKGAMQHVWSNYEKLTFGADEIKPISGRADNNWGRHAALMVDAIDTLWLMGMKDEVDRAAAFFENHSFSNGVKGVSFFETTIRYVGGLIAAYDLTGKDVFKQRALELARVQHVSGGSIAQLGTFQMEYARLSEITGHQDFAKRALDQMRKLLQWPNIIDGLVPTHRGSRKYSMGAEGDSFYEYLIKTYILRGQRKEDEWLIRAFADSVIGMEKHLTVKTPKGWFLGEKQNGSLQKNMGHLACFVGGMLTLPRTHNIDLTKYHAKLTHDFLTEYAKGLGEACWTMYQSSPTLVAPESVRFKDDGSVSQMHRMSFLRPEFLETLFWLWRETKDPVYRERAWKIFQALDKHTKTKFGYAELNNVNNASSKKDKMETFFLAETLKYAYIIFGDDSILPGSDWVLNTEAHPFRKFS